MAELKTKVNSASVGKFLSSIENKTRQADAKRLLTIFKEVTNTKPKMWGENIIGFGLYKYKYESGREGAWFTTGFSPRKQNLSIYIMPGFSEVSHLLDKLGKHKVGKSCLYVNKLSDIDESILRKIIALSVKQIGKLYTCK